MSRGLSPTQRTMRHLREQGNICAVVEKWNQFGGPRRPDGAPIGNREDLFGIVDILVLDPERGFVGIQACGQSFADHLRKLTGECAQQCIDWLSTPGGHLEIWSWRKIKIKRGGIAKRWSPRVRELTMEDFS